MSNNENFNLDLDFLDEEAVPEIKKSENSNNMDFKLDSESPSDIILDGNSNVDTEDSDISVTVPSSTLTVDDDPLGLGTDMDISTDEPGISLDDEPTNDISSVASISSEIPNSSGSGSSIKDKLMENKLYLGIAGGVLLLSIIGGVAFMVFSGNSAPKKPVVVTPPPTQEQGLIDDQSDETATGAAETASGAVETATEQNSQSGETTEVNTSSGTEDTKSSTASTDIVEQNSETSSGGNVQTPSTEKKDPSDISIPLKSVTEKIEVNSDGSLKKTSNSDIETRNVKEGSIIIDNSQNKLPNLLDLNIEGVKDGQTFKISDEIKVSLNGITNSLSIEPTVKGTANKDAYILAINLSFYKNSIISSEKGTLTHSETLPLDFMKTGKKTLYVMVNGIIFKTINFNIQ